MFNVEYLTYWVLLTQVKYAFGITPTSSSISIVLYTIIPSLKTLILIILILYGPEYLERVMAILEGTL